MAKNKDKWSALSMKDRADLIKLYVSNGVTSLNDIKKDYNSFGGGGNTDGDSDNDTTPTEKKLTLEEFLQAKADSTRVAAHAKSLSRDEGVEIIYPLSESRKEANQQFVDQYYDLNPEFVGPVLLRRLSVKPAYDQAMKELNNNCEYGLNCIGTATDNYPEDSREVSNESFRGNYEEKGFYIVPFEEKLPGDIVQQGGHSVIFDSYKRDPHPTLPQAFGDAYPVYNYSNGSIGTEAYRKQKRYPFTEPVVYRYVGTPTLIQQWTEEYNEQNKKFGGKINTFATGGNTDGDDSGIVYGTEGGTELDSSVVLAYKTPRKHFDSSINIDTSNIEHVKNDANYWWRNSDEYQNTLHNAYAEDVNKILPFFESLKGGKFSNAYDKFVGEFMSNKKTNLNPMFYNPYEYGTEENAEFSGLLFDYQYDNDMLSIDSSAVAKAINSEAPRDFNHEAEYNRYINDNVASAVGYIGDLYESKKAKRAIRKANRYALRKGAPEYFTHFGDLDRIALNVSPMGSETYLKGNTISLDMNVVPYNYSTTLKGNIAHEAAHSRLLYNSKDTRKPFDNPELISEIAESSPYYGFDYGYIRPKHRRWLTATNSVNDHDNELAESYSDLMELRMKMHAAGIVDGTKQRYRNKHIKEYMKTLDMEDRYLSLHPNIRHVRKALNRVWKDGGKLNLFGPGGPKDTKHVEDVVRTTRGSTGKIFTKDFPFVDFLGAKHLWDSWRVMRGNDGKVAPSDDNYTGTAMVGVGVQTDDGLGFASQQDLANVLGYTPTDFVDAYVYGNTPFEELGVFKKEDSPERQVVRSKVKKVEDSGKQVNTYQTQRDTLDTNTVAALDSLLNAGLVDLHSRNTTYQESPFNIGDSGIIYDGNNSTIATAYLPNGMPVSKAIDVFDTDPTEWNYKVGPLAKTGLGFIHDNTNPFLMTTPWYYPIKSTDYLSRLYYLFGIDADRDYNVRENKGDKNGVIWDIHEALEWLDNHPDLTEMPVKDEKD